MSRKRKISDRVRMESFHVRQKLGDSVICDRCSATLDDFADKCPADLVDQCPGFLAIEAARSDFVGMTLANARRDFFSRHPNLRTAGFDDRDSLLWSAITQLPSYGLIGGSGDVMVSRDEVIGLIHRAAEERFKREFELSRGGRSV